MIDLKLTIEAHYGYPGASSMGATLLYASTVPPRPP